MIDEEEVEKSFWISRPDDWVVNRKMKKIILLEFKRTTDYSESYYRDMWRVSEQQHTPILRSGWNPSRSLGSGKKTARRLYRDLGSHY